MSSQVPPPSVALRSMSGSAILSSAIAASRRVVGFRVERRDDDAVTVLVHGQAAAIPTVGTRRREPRLEPRRGSLRRTAARTATRLLRYSWDKCCPTPWADMRSSTHRASAKDRFAPNPGAGIG
jgi:hypothetical protein